MIKIDKAKNAKFYNTYKPCDCMDCRNFCMQIRSACKELSAYFDKNSIDIEKPWELVSFEQGDKTEYKSCQYLIFGDCSDDFEMGLDNIKLKKELDGHPSTSEYEKPNFVLEFSIALINNISK